MSAIAGRYGRAREAATSVAERPIFDPMLCPKCGGAKQRADWIVCIACAVTFDNEAVDSFAAARDALATWIVDAEAVLETLPDDDSRKPKALEVWKRKTATYMSLCWLLRDVSPEVVV
jgi:hypothetical protein